MKLDKKLRIYNDFMMCVNNCPNWDDDTNSLVSSISVEGLISGKYSKNDLLKEISNNDIINEYGYGEDLSAETKRAILKYKIKTLKKEFTC